ncbi:MAG: DegT/DnrJ/EryC1/StrS family aminotransferase [Chloroflexi bacterium]|nr:DegT/DnrJ/EryC1/StrS family aminotransferase [Chloroflexota bacterium]
MPKLAIHGGTPAKTKPFPVWPIFDERERQALNEVLESRIWWRTPGTKTLAFEREFAAYHEARHGIAVTNGTHALEVALAAMGIGAGDEVIVPNSTFVATASAVLFAGALPVLVDVRADSYCIDPELAEAAITENTKAIIAVHMGGRPADLDQLTAVAEKHGLMLLEDAAHAHGSEWRGRKVGTFGVGGTFSFQASKTMTAGEGGMIISNDDDFERLARATHDCGRLPGKWFYDHFVYGSNYRLSEWQGAVLLAQLSRLDEQTARRHRNGRLLDRRLSEIPGITPQSHDSRITRNGQYAYIFHYDRRAFAGVDTNRFVEALEAEGIPTQAPYPPLNQLDVFTSGAYRDRLSGAQARASHDFLKDAFPNSQREAWETVWITQNALLGDEEDMREIAAAIGKIGENARDLL